MATVPKATEKVQVCPITLEDKEIVLGILDTYHDFCKSERMSKSEREKRTAKKSPKSASNNESVDSENSDDEDTTRIEVMRNYLPRLLNKVFPEKIKQVEDYQNNVKTITCGELSSVSAIEHKAVEMFESDILFRDSLNAAPECREVLTFQQIIDAYSSSDKTKKTTLLNRFKLNAPNRILELSRSGRRFGKDPTNEAEEKQEIEYLSDFILQYFFGPTGPTIDVYMTFDAGERIVGDIFHNREKVKCVIFPETLADSATTSFGMLDGRNEYVFPKTEEIIEFTSNIFSKKNYDIKIVNSGFNEQNPYGFSLVIQHKTKSTLKLELPFSAKQSQGPSVNYLIDILKTAETNAQLRKDHLRYSDIKRSGTMLNLGGALDSNKAFRTEFEKEVGEDNNGIIPDLKRGGDHEAVLASKYVKQIEANKYQNFIFCTIDILCGLKSRIEKNNTIWQGKDKIILYRYDGPLQAADPLVEYIRTGKEIYEVLTKINAFKSVDLKKELTNQKAKCDLAKDALINYTDRKKEPYYKIPCEEMLNAFLRFAILDLSEYCDSLIANTDLQFKTITLKEGEIPIDTLTSLFLEFYDEKPELKPKLSDGVFTTTIDTKPISLNLLETKKTVVEAYDAMTKKVKEYLDLDIYSGQDTEIRKGGIVTQAFTIEKDLTELRANSSGNNDTIFKLEEHPVFGYIPGIFEKFYDHLMFLQDLAYKNKLKASREYDNILRKILFHEASAPFDFFQTVDDILDGFHSEKYKEDIANIIDLRRLSFKGKTADERFQLLKLYLLGDDILFDETQANAVIAIKQYSDVSRKENGIVENIRNYYTILEEAGKFSTGNGYLSYEEPPKAVAAAAVAAVPRSKKTSKKILQNGGERRTTPSIFQYYDLNSLLYRISVEAATFIESSYCELYPAYQLLHMFTSINQTETISSVQLKFKDVIKKIEAFLEDGSRSEKADGYRGSVLQKSAVTGHLGLLNRKLSSPLDKAKDIKDSSDKLTEVFHLLCKSDGTTIEYPSIKEFLQTLSSDSYIIHSDNFDVEEIRRISELADPSAENIDILRTMMADKILIGTQVSENLDALWQEGIYEVRQDKDYIYEFDNDRRGFSSEELISYLLTLGIYSQGSSEYTVTGILGGYDIPITSTNPANKRYDIYSYLGDSVFFFDKIPRTLERSELLKELQGIKDFVNMIKTPGYAIDVKTTLLFLFTLVENVMNKTGKKSLFLTGTFTKTQFEAKAYWRGNLYRLLTHLLQTLSLTIPTTGSKINLVRERYLSGGTYPKKTRKYAARKGSRKSTKYNRTRRTR
jgi:hypothetical protein